jgi:hypothetical protein
MEFFNKKEEVLDVELTEYGEYLLAIGKLNPTYYAFFDDDVQYDVSGSGYTEVQNDAEQRIQYNTPQLKILRSRSGAETRVSKFLNNVSSSMGTLSQNSTTDDYVDIFRTQQSFTDIGKIASHPIGNSSLKTPYNASWRLEVLSEPKIVSASRNYQPDPNGPIENIPQIDITIDYKTFFREGDMSADSITGYLDNSNIYLALQDNYLVLEIIEENTNFEKENFDIQVYHSSSGEDGVGVYTQKQFYVDNPEADFIASSPAEVEYYINVLTDSQIPQEVLDKLNISDRALRTNSRLRLNRDLYTTDNEEPC